MPASQPPTKMRFDAFISYSLSSDQQLAAALEYEMQKYAKPWHRRRAAHIFRDVTNLAINPNLWGSITKNLSNSEHLILLASPSSSDSHWVTRELCFWLSDGVCDTAESFDLSLVSTRQAERLLIVLTDGEIAWKDDQQGFDWNLTNALPKILKGVFVSEPFWLDLRWAKSSKLKLNHKNDAFMLSVAKLSAPIRGLDIEELVSQNYSEYKRTMRHATYAIITLSALLIIAVVLFFRTLLLAEAAREERTVAQTNESRLLASLSKREAEQQNSIAAALLARRGLPKLHEPDLSNQRPLVREAALALDEALYSYASSRLIWKFEGHRGQRQAISVLDDQRSINGVSFSPDGENVLSSGSDARARLLSTVSGQQVGVLEHTFDVKDAMFSHNGDFIVTGSKDGTAAVWDSKSLDKIAELAHWKVDTCNEENGFNIMHSVESIDVSPDSKLIATSSGDAAVRLWSMDDVRKTTTPKPTQCVKGQSHAKFDRSGKLLLSRGKEGKSVVLKATNTVEWARLDDKLPETTGSINFSPKRHKKLLLQVGNDNAQLWDMEQGNLSQATPFGKKNLVYTNFDGAGNPFALTLDQQHLVYWDLSLEQPRFHFPANIFGPGSSITKIAIGSAVKGGNMEKGQLFLSYSNQKMPNIGARGVLIDINSGDIISFLNHPWGHVTDAVFSKDGSRLSTGSSNGEVALWDTSFRERGKVLRGHRDKVNEVHSDPNNPNILSTVSSDGSVITWNLKTLMPINHFKFAVGPLRALKISPDGGSIAVRSDSGAILLKSAKTNKTKELIKKNGMTMLFDRNSGDLFTGDRSRRALHWANSGETKKTLFMADARIHSMDFMQDGQWLLTGHGDPMIRRDNNVHLYDLQKNQRLLKLTGHELPISGVSANDSVNRVITYGMDGLVILWDSSVLVDAAAKDIPYLEPKDAIATISVSKTKIYEQHGRIKAPKVFATFSPNGDKFIAAEINGSIWDSSDGSLVAKLIGHSGQINHAVFSPNSKLIATASSDMTVRVWSADSGAVLTTFRGHTAQVNHLNFINDSLLASASDDGTVRIWNLLPNWTGLIETAETILPRKKLSAAELQRAFLLQAPQ